MFSSTSVPSDEHEAQLQHGSRLGYHRDRVFRWLDPIMRDLQDPDEDILDRDWVPHRILLRQHPRNMYSLLGKIQLLSGVHYFDGRILITRHCIPLQCFQCHGQFLWSIFPSQGSGNPTVE